MQAPERRRRWTVGELLTWTTERFQSHGIADPRVDAEHLLANALGCRRLDLYLQHDRLLDEPERAPFREMVRRRLAREPVAYIEGVRGFHALDLELSVDRRVLVPRPETEHLVDWVLETLRPPPSPPQTIVDVGTGSGAIALAVKHARHDVDVVAVDTSAEALAVARANAQRLELDVVFQESDLLATVSGPEGGFDVVAANLPYIPSADLAELQPEVRNFEPMLALDGGPDGLDLVRRLVVEARSVTAPHGHLIVEIGIGQAQATEALMREAGWVEVGARADYSEIPRVVAGRFR